MNNVLVAGDLAIDNHIYQGERLSSKQTKARGVKELYELGGAFNIYKILKQCLLKAAEADKNKKEGEAKKNESDKEVKPYYLSDHWEVGSRFPQSGNNSKPLLISYATWKPILINNDKANKDEYVWRIDKEMGYGEQNATQEIGKLLKKANNPVKDTTSPKILVVDSAGHQFNNEKDTELAFIAPRYDWIIIKLSSPIAKGEIWQELITRNADKLITILSADELRKEDYKIAKGLSWEQTIEDTRDVLSSSFSVLQKSRHLIICYSNDGALWIDNTERNNPVATFLCDTARAEGEFSKAITGKVFGYMSCFTAGIVYSLMSKSRDVAVSEIATGIERGLSAMRHLLESGHGTFKGEETEQSCPRGFQAELIADDIRNPKYKMANIKIQWPQLDSNSEAGKWMIAEMLQRSPSAGQQISLSGLAMQVVYYGKKILSDIPHAVFGKLTTTDRGEIETLRQIQKFMEDYRNNPKAKKPISFGVFGPPGAGKSFGVKQIAEKIMGKDSWMEFNLSQFSAGNLNELYGMFHQIRDRVLSGVTPVVLIDEFDSKQYEWLQYLLSPMQEGQFQQGQIKHSIGKCIFVFAGGTSHSFEKFGQFPNDKEGIASYKDFVLKKGPDFRSRLDGYINVLGPNQKLLNPETDERDPNDISWPLRRAIFISSKIKYQSYLPAGIDFGLVNALLLVPKYVHGSRSLEKLLSLLQTADGTTISRSNLPTKAQLEMYVYPVNKFFEYLNQPDKTLQFLPVDELAPAIHESYRLFSKENGWQINARFDKPYEQLDQEAKDDNKAAAIRFQNILAAVNLRIKKAEAGEPEIDKAIIDHLEHHIELLSKLEHNGWMTHKFAQDWKYGEKRDDSIKRHNLLKPYEELPNNEKQKDRNSIKDYPKRLKMVGYEIVWM